jgi:hypothetical protein
MPRTGRCACGSPRGGRVPARAPLCVCTYSYGTSGRVGMRYSLGAEAGLGALEPGASFLLAGGALTGEASLTQILRALALPVRLARLHLVHPLLPACPGPRPRSTLSCVGSGVPWRAHHCCLLFCLRFSSRLRLRRSRVGSSLTFCPSARSSDACHAWFSSMAAACTEPAPVHPV